MLKILLLIPALLLAACEPADSPAASGADGFQARRAALAEAFSPCARDSTVPFAALAAQADCLVFEVPENPARPDGRRIPLKLMRIPAFRVNPLADPLVILVGGPGQAATSAGLAIAAILNPVRQEREILLVDQRGTGELSPFDCDFGDEEEIFDASMPYILERQAGLLRDCLRTIEADPAFYTTDIAVQDLERIREYLGYEAFNLWGGSYGTRVALAYLQAYPDRTRSVVLDGVAPPAIRLPLNLARDSSASFEKVLALCATDPRCDAAFPALQAHFQELMQRLETPASIKLPGPPGGEAREAELDRDLLAPILRGALYSREYIRLLPLMIELAYRGDYQALTSITPSETDINQGMFLSVICSEDMSLVSQGEVEQALAADQLLASALLITPMVEACGIWPRRELDPAYFEPVAADRPVLILSGELDPVTPPSWGDLVAQTLSNSRHLVARGVAHIVTPYGCSAELISEFIASADPQAPDAACLEDLRPRPFFLSSGGSEASDD